MYFDLLVTGGHILDGTGSPGFPGDIGIRNGRGLVREGFHADLVVFEPDEVIDRARYEEPHQDSVGIDYVVVGGQVVVDEGRITTARPRRVLRGSGYRGQGEGH